jgi:hypothetical protein
MIFPVVAETKIEEAAEFSEAALEFVGGGGERGTG